MTNTNDLREMIALADWLQRLAKPENGVGVHLEADERATIVTALRTSASRADFDAGRVAGQRDMQERAKDAAHDYDEGRLIYRYNGKLIDSTHGDRIASAIASLPLNVESGKESDGGVFARMADDGGMPSIPPETVEHAILRTASEIEAVRVASKRPSDPSPDSASAVREAIDREEKYLIEHFDAECDIMPGDVEGSFHRLRAALAAATKAEAAPGPMGGAK